MVLLDSIIAHSEAGITCIAHSHLDPHNPLRISKTLSIYAGIEYAAQAMAVHSKLCAAADQPPRRGVVAVASKLQAHYPQLDSFAVPLQIDVNILVRNDTNSLCGFRLCAGEKELLCGQLTAIIIDPALA